MFLVMNHIGKGPPIMKGAEDKPGVYWLICIGQGGLDNTFLAVDEEPTNQPVVSLDIVATRTDVQSVVVRPKALVQAAIKLTRLLIERQG